MPERLGRGPDREGQIVTFYSFKGGTGRTMALANVAWILAANGMRVLAADWDLESPGLHRFFQPFLDPSASERPGIVDFVRHYEWAAVEADIPAEALVSGPPDRQAAARAAIDQLVDEHIGHLSGYIVPLNWQFPGLGALHFLAPGKQAIDYQATLSALEWDNFYNDLHGGQFFDALRAGLKADYDYVLIDSRTGLSDIADICTVHLPDSVIDCFTLSTQGIESGALMATSIQSHADRDITIWPVPMRIDRSREDRVTAGLELAVRQFSGLPSGMPPEQRRSYWSEVEVPYKPAYAYEETLAVFGDRPGSGDSLLSSYERITARITGGSVVALPGQEEWLRLRTQLLFSRLPDANPPEVVLDSSPEDQLWAEWIAAVLAAAGVAVSWADERRAGPATEIGAQAQLVVVMSEGRARRLRDTARQLAADLVISVDDHRLPAELADVPVVLLAGRGEADAVAVLADRLGGQAPDRESLEEIRYPGAERRQIIAIPARNENFTGREADLRQLRDELRSAQMAVVLPLTIQGLGGSGKTQLALEYAHRFKADYDIVWWLNCGQPQYVDAALGDLGTRLREELGASLPEGGAAELARRVLRYLSDSETPYRWLLIYDNAEDIETVARLLPSGRGHVVITSRDETWQARGGSRSLTVDGFKREESISHLRHRLPGVTDDEAGQVAAVLGDMPLAVAAAGALLATTRMPVSELLRELDRQNGPDLADGHPLRDYPPAVAKAWSLSLDQLRLRSAAAARLLSICSAMAPDISLDLIRSQAMADALAVLDPTISERMMIARLIRQIDLLALIKVDNQAHQVQVDRMVQAVVSERMSQAERRAVQRDVHGLLVAARPDGDVDDPGTWPRFRVIWPHLTPSEAMRSASRPVRDLLIERVRYLRLRDDLDRGVRLAEGIDRAWVEMLTGIQDPGEQQALREQLFRLRFNTANILRDLGQLEQARHRDEEVLRGQGELLGDEHPHTLQTRSSLGADLRALGEYRAALDLDLATYHTWSQASGYGEEFPGTLSAAHNLALSYLLNGDFRNALRHDRQTLERRRRVHGSSHPRTLNSGQAVARDLLEAGRYGEAAAVMEEVWAGCRETLGSDDRTTLNARLWLGIAVRCSGHPDLAAPHIDAARVGLTRGFGRDSGDALSSRLSNAVNLMAMQRFGEAQAQVAELLTVYEGRVGSSHPHTLIARLDLSAVLYGVEDFAVAADHAQKAAAGLHDRLGAVHPYTLAATMMLATTLIATQGDLARAAELEGQVITERTRILGAGHPDTLRARANHLLTQHDLGRQAASAERQEVIAELASVLGSQHPNISLVMNGRRLLSVIDPQPF